MCTSGERKDELIRADAIGRGQDNLFGQSCFLSAVVCMCLCVCVCVCADVCLCVSVFVCVCVSG